MSTKTFWFSVFLEHVTKLSRTSPSILLNILFIIPKTFWFFQCFTRNQAASRSSFLQDPAWDYTVFTSGHTCASTQEPRSTSVLGSLVRQPLSPVFRSFTSSSAAVTP